MAFPSGVNIITFSNTLLLFFLGTVGRVVLQRFHTGEPTSRTVTARSFAGPNCLDVDCPCRALEQPADPW